MRPSAKQIPGLVAKSGARKQLNLFPWRSEEKKKGRQKERKTGRRDNLKKGEQFNIYILIRLYI